MASAALKFSEKGRASAMVLAPPDARPKLIAATTREELRPSHSHWKSPKIAARNPDLL
jgi:hypothetical protein